MMTSLRSSLKSVVVWLLLGMLALAFGLSFGLPSDAISCGVEPLAKTYGENILDEDYQYQFQAISLVLPMPKDEKFQETIGIKQEVLDAILERRVLAKIGERMGLAAVKEDAEELTSDGHVIVLGDTYDFLGEGAFNYDAFKQRHLPRFMVTEPKYLEYQRQELLARTVRDVLASALTVSEAELRAEYEGRQNQLSLRYVRFEAERFADLIDPSEADVNKYIEAHRDELVKQFEAQGVRFTKLPKQLRLRYIQIKKPQPPAEDADKETKAKYAAELKAATAKSAAAAGRMKDGEDFRVIARQVSEDPMTAARGGDYGWTSVDGTGTGLDPVIDTTAATLKAGETSPVVESEEGLYLVRVDGLREGDVPQEEALRELAEEGVVRERGKALAKQAAAEALQALKDGKQLTELFKSPDALGQDQPGIDALPIEGELGGAPAVEAATGPEIRVTGLFARERPIPGLGENAELTKAAWAADPKAEFIDGVFEATDGFVIAAVEKKETATDEGLAAARAGLYRELADKKAKRITSRFAKNQCLADKARGDIVPREQKIQRLMIYETKLDKDAEGNQQLKPYVMCDRVGGRGGMLRAAAMMGATGGGGGEP
ncbi:MAG: peptidylprolyl isomerase [Nannocystis sp.]|nr:peptidylprolyl isomerase [Nannocystis sp.]MBA3544933.1 peptidylprolyl isomerase [Nannocystis sp.]